MINGHGFKTKHDRQVPKQDALANQVSNSNFSLAPCLAVLFVFQNRHECPVLTSPPNPHGRIPGPPRIPKNPEDSEHLTFEVTFFSHIV